MAELTPELLQKLEELKAADAKERNEEVQRETNESAIPNLNYGISNVLGMPVDLAVAVAKLVGAVESDFDPYGSSTSIRNGMRSMGMALPEEGYRPDKFGARLSRMAGETALPAMALYGQGAKLATQAGKHLTGFQTSLLQAFNNPIKTATAESAAVLAGTSGGYLAEEAFPDSDNAQVLGELFGSMSPSLAVSVSKHLADSSVVKSLPSVKAAALLKAGASNFMNSLSPTGSKRRAEDRTTTLASDPESALDELASESILNLDPLTQSGDVGLMTMLKAITKQGDDTGLKFSDSLAKLTEQSMLTARGILLKEGNPEAVTDFVNNLFTYSASKSQRAIENLGTTATPDSVARVLRENIESAHTQARNVEKVMWNSLPDRGKADPTNLVNKLIDLTDSTQRSATAKTISSEDIPKWVFDAIGRRAPPKPSKRDALTGKVTTYPAETVLGVTTKNPDLANLKDLRSKLGEEVAKERALDVPNRNKIRILNELNSEALSALESISPEYANAVKYSRELNDKFTKGKVAKILGNDRQGADRVSPEGTFDFLVSGSKDQIRLGMEQLKQASPEAVKQLEEGLKVSFGAITKSSSGAFNTTAARKFLEKNEIILDNFPELRQNINEAIRAQSTTDAIAGANIGSEVSTQIKQKSVASLFLNKDVNEGMKSLLGRRTGAGQARAMQEMIDLVGQDKSGDALSGLKSAFGQFLLKHAEVSGTVHDLSGVEMTKLLEDMRPAAKRLYSKEELSNLDQLAKELTKVENRKKATPARGGVINDSPSKIISMFGRVAGAQLGGKMGQASAGGSMQSASILSGEARGLIDRLTNDGANSILVQAITNKNLLEDLLKTNTPENLKLFAERYSNLIPVTSVTGIQAGIGLMDDRTGKAKQTSDLTLEESMAQLRARLNAKPPTQQTLQNNSQSVM